MSRLMRDGKVEPVSRDQVLRHERGQVNVNFPCSSDHEQDWQPCPVGPYSAIRYDRFVRRVQRNNLFLRKIERARMARLHKSAMAAERAVSLELPEFEARSREAVQTGNQ